MSKQELTSKIERLEAFEDRCEVRIECLSAWFDPDYEQVKVMFELHPKSGVNLKESISVEIVLYNTKGQIIEKDSVWFNSDKFWGFEVSDCSIHNAQIDEILKIRVYPKID